VIGDWVDAVVRPDESLDVQRSQRGKDVWRARHRRSDYDIHVEDCIGRRAEPGIDVHTPTFRLLLQRRDPDDVESEVVAEIEAQRRRQCVDGVVCIGVRRAEEDVDILAVPSGGQPGEQRAGALEHPSVSIVGTEQAGECSVVAELALEFIE